MLIRNNRKMRFFAFAAVNAHLSRSNGFEFAFKFAIDQKKNSTEGYLAGNTKFQIGRSVFSPADRQISRKKSGQAPGSGMTEEYPNG